MSKYFFILLFCLPLLVSAQLQDDFSDGDFTQNPTWSGNDTQFKVSTSFQLQLNSLGSDTSYLSTTNSSINQTEWRFYTKLSFNTSSNNLARIYLASSQPNIDGSLNGYFVEIGNTADNVCLYRQDGIIESKLINGTLASSAGSVNAISIKVIHDNAGKWELFTDPSGSSNFISEGSFIDTTYKTSSWFGVFCKYTSSNATKFAFDDFYIGPIQVDSIGPIMQNIIFTSSKSIDVTFNEALDNASANTINNYQLYPLAGSIDSCRLDANNKSLVHLYFSSNFQSGTNYNLSISNIKDLKGNSSLSQNLYSVYYIPKAYDIVFNEIMASPNPPVGLPSAEYLELKNNTAYPINLQNWKLQMGSTVRYFPSIKIEANSYLLLCYQNDTNLLKSFGNYLSFSSFSLTNAGMQLILFDGYGNMIHQVNYADTWYADNNKKAGGWSLEMMDSKNPCGCENNYKASVNLQGGTPNAANSVIINNLDKTSPYIQRIIVVDQGSIILKFSESMDSSHLSNLNAYFVDGNIGKPLFFQNYFPDYKSVFLFFNYPIQPHIVYTLSIEDTLTDCVGNMIPISTSLKYGLADSTKVGEILINEVLFNPKDDGVDYIELYNNSSKIFDLKNMRISNWNEAISQAENVYEITSEGFLLFPHSYVILSTNGKKVRSQYIHGPEQDFLDVKTLPSMSNEYGNIAILKSSLELLDWFSYTSEMQYPLLVSVEGVSLERIRFNEATQNKSNWHSASEAMLFGTPALKNSQHIDAQGIIGTVEVNPEIFSPDNDGFEDVSSIAYTFEQAGYTANVMIFNAAGQRVRYLVNNELVGISGYWVWNGFDDANQKLSFGIYIIYIEVFDLNGKTQKYKKSVVLGGKI